MNYSKFQWITDDARLFLSRGYLEEGVSVERRYKQICNALEKQSGIEGFSSKMYQYCKKGWISFATPVLINYGHGDNLPASCNYGYVNDSLDDILTTLHEVGMLSKYGAGTAVDFSNIRPIGKSISNGGKSNGVVPWIKLYEELINKVSQGSSRRGFLTAYLKADHSDIMDFLDIGTPTHDIQHITTGVVFPKGYIDDIKSGDKIKRRVYAKILKRRSELGFPYIVFEDNCLENISPVSAQKTNININTSNICTEVMADVNPQDETFVCVLTSVNALHFDEWKDTDLVYDVRIALDCITQEYIDKAEGRKGFENALNYIKSHRSVGLGVLGFHSYLQSNMIPFGSLESYRFNNQLFSHLRTQCDSANLWMGKEWGESEYCKGTGYRGDLSIAVAPTKSTSFIMGALSSGIEPIKSNIHQKVLAKIQTTYKNPFLEEILLNHRKNSKKTWKSISENNGSVSHLDFLTDLEKNVFKTFSEISQVDVIKLAGQRQQYIDQGQSINVMIHPNTKPKQISDLVLMAYDEGVKTLYYQYSINAAQDYNKELLKCSACEG